MIKMVFLCRRRPDLSRDEYARRILESHAPLALVHHPNMRRYVIQIVEGRPADGDAIDSLPTLWFDSVEDFRERLHDSPEGQAIIQRDVRCHRLIDRFGGLDTRVQKLNRALEVLHLTCRFIDLALGQFEHLLVKVT